MIPKDSISRDVVYVFKNLHVNRYVSTYRADCVYTSDLTGYKLLVSYDRGLNQGDSMLQCYQGNLS